VRSLSLCRKKAHISCHSLASSSSQSPKIIKQHTQRAIITFGVYCDAPYVPVPHRIMVGRSFFLRWALVDICGGESTPPARRPARSSAVTGSRIVPALTVCRTLLRSYPRRRGSVQRCSSSPSREGSMTERVRIEGVWWAKKYTPKRELCSASRLFNTVLDPLLRSNFLCDVLSCRGRIFVSRSFFPRCDGQMHYDGSHGVQHTAVRTPPARGCRVSLFTPAVKGREYSGKGED